MFSFESFHKEIIYDWILWVRTIRRFFPTLPRQNAWHLVVYRGIDRGLDFKVIVSIKVRCHLKRIYKLCRCRTVVLSRYSLRAGETIQPYKRIGILSPRVWHWGLDNRGGPLETFTFKSPGWGLNYLVFETPFSDRTRLRLLPITTSWWRGLICNICRRYSCSQK